MHINRFYDKLLTTLECVKISHQMFTYAQDGLCVTTPDLYVDNIFGYYNLPTTLDLVHKLTGILEQDYGVLGTLQFANTYTRIYKTGSYLRVHVDRPGLDVTLSTCVYNDTGCSWPIYATEHEMDRDWMAQRLIEPPEHVVGHEYVTNPGQGVAIRGTKTPHWRKVLECKPEQSVIQVFWHWTVLTETDK